MTLSRPAVARLRASATALERVPSRPGACFYDHLFRIAPQVRPLFPADMDEQGRKLVGMLAAAVAHMDYFDELGPALTALAERHIRHGAEPGHHATVRTALLRMVAEIDPACDDATLRAWAAAYDAISARMIAAAAATAPGSEAAPHAA
jgi:nitric oxide dioxygenase